MNEIAFDRIAFDRPTLSAAWQEHTHAEQLLSLSQDFGFSPRRRRARAIKRPVAALSGDRKILDLLLAVGATVQRMESFFDVNHEE